MGSSWVNVKSERQAWRLQLQAGADPAILRQNFFFLQEASGFALRAFDWLDEATTVLGVIPSTSILMMDVSHIHKIPSWQCLDQCLNHWRLAWPSWHRKLTITVPVKFLSFEKLQHLHYYYCICSLSGFALKSIFCGELNKWALLVLCVHDRELLEKEQCLLEILKWSMPSPDLWSSVGLGADQAGRTISVFWNLSVPHPSEWGVRAQ